MRGASPDPPKGANMRRSLFKAAVFILFVLIAMAWTIPGDSDLQAAILNIDLGPEGAEGALGPLQLLIFLALITLIPSILIMMTSFTRIIVVFSFLRNALGAQAPPSQVIIGISLFLSFFIMWPVGVEMYDAGVEPFLAGEISQSECLESMAQPLKIFMLKQIKAPELNLFLSFAGDESLL